MIPLQRARTELSIPAKYRAPDKNRHELALMQLHLAGEEPDPSHWTAAKRWLKREAFGKCAYCEAPTDTVAHGDVEHFRPKATYWWLAYCWDNLLFACQICNQSHKRLQFPVAGRRMREWELESADLEAIAGSLAPCPLDGDDRYDLAAYARELATERADLLDPYREDPAAMLAWEADPIDRVVRVIPGAQDPITRRRANACVRVLGLNREELGRERWKTHRILGVLAEAWKKLPDDDPLRAETERALRSMLADDAAFAGMCRFFVRKIWVLPL
jgi:uncharacterized protein (TIGR02646 family)